MSSIKRKGNERWRVSSRFSLECGETQTRINKGNITRSRWELNLKIFNPPHWERKNTSEQVLISFNLCIWLVDRIGRISKPTKTPNYVNTLLKNWSNWQCYYFRHEIVRGLLTLMIKWYIAPWCNIPLSSAWWAVSLLISQRVGRGRSVFPGLIHNAIVMTVLMC